jgi:aminomethyltransferase
MSQAMNANRPTVDQSTRSVPINLHQSGPTPAELLISTRIRKSPYWHLSIEAGCWRAEVYNRVYHPRGYVRHEDGGAMVEYDALVNRVTMWDVAVERKIRVQGPDAEAFVDFVITRDATKIAPMRARYVLLCNDKGGILNDPVLLRLADDEFWFSVSDSYLMLWLQGRTGWPSSRLRTTAGSPQASCHGARTWTPRQSRSRSISATRCPAPRSATTRWVT